MKRTETRPAMATAPVRPAEVWGVLWECRSQLDGHTRHLVRQGCVPVLFRTREQAREWISAHYGFLRTRADLRAEPHGWRMPKAVRVRIEANPNEATP